MRSAVKMLTSLYSATRIALTILIALAVLWAGWASAAPAPSPSPVTGDGQSSQPQIINPPQERSVTGLPNQTGVLLVIVLLIVILIIGESLRPAVPPQYVPPEHHSAEGHHSTEEHPATEPH